MFKLDSEEQHYFLFHENFSNNKIVLLWPAGIFQFLSEQKSVWNIAGAAQQHRSVSFSNLLITVSTISLIHLFPFKDKKVQKDVEANGMHASKLEENQKRSSVLAVFKKVSMSCSLFPRALFLWKIYSNDERDRVRLISQRNSLLKWWYNGFSCRY